MKYLIPIDKNTNFYINKDMLLFNINVNEPIADLSNNGYGQNFEKGRKVREKVEFFASGAKVTIESFSEKCVQYYLNDGKMLVETICHRGQNKDDVSILPIDLGVFSSHCTGRGKVVHMFVDYASSKKYADPNFSKVYNNVKDYVEGKGAKGKNVNQSYMTASVREKGA